MYHSQFGGWVKCWTASAGAISVVPSHGPASRLMDPVTGGRFRRRRARGPPCCLRLPPPPQCHEAAEDGENASDQGGEVAGDVVARRKLGGGAGRQAVALRLVHQQEERVEPAVD